MPVGKIPQDKIASIAGVRLATIAAGVRYPGRKDLVLFEFDDKAVVSAVFTQNHFAAAPVLVCREHLQKAKPKYLIINSGNANAGTGDEGIKLTRKVCQSLAAKAKVEVETILPFSTGVTAEILPADRITAKIDDLFAGLTSDGWNDAAEGIMTTDTVPKGRSLNFELDGEKVTISGITKGSGMIKPNMATMLSFIATDAKVAKATLDAMLTEAVAKSFNRITVDGDTSTNDSCVLVASCCGVKITARTQLRTFQENLNKLMRSLAQDMVRDAEGASKFITINVTSGNSEKECLKVAYTIAHSPLVKTAFFAGDPNWGRIMVALGNVEIDNVDTSKINAYLDDVQILAGGQMAETYSEDAGLKVMQQEEITINIDLGRGAAKETVWTSDLSHEYITINADYRT